MEVKVSSANCKGEELESAKLIDENETPPEVTSGTLPMVLAVPQVTCEASASAESCTSAGSAVLPTIKQAACLSLRTGATAASQHS